MEYCVERIETEMHCKRKVLSRSSPYRDSRDFPLLLCPLWRKTVYVKGLNLTQKNSIVDLHKFCPVIFERPWTAAISGRVERRASAESSRPVTQTSEKPGHPAWTIVFREQVGCVEVTARTQVDDVPWHQIKVKCKSQFILISTYCVCYEAYGRLQRSKSCSMSVVTW